MLTKDKATNVVLVILVIIVLVALSLSVRIRPVADRVLLLKKSAHSLSGRTTETVKRLQSEKGVASVEPDITDHFLIVGFDSKAVSPRSIALATIASGIRYDISKVISAEDYKMITGKDLASVTAKSCGGRCGDKN